MDTITVKIGTVTKICGRTNDTRRTVQFEGEKLGEYREYGQGRKLGKPDTRGKEQTLYRTADGRYIVHVLNWSRWTGEPNTEQLIEVQFDDMQGTGPYAHLGDACGIGRHLTLDEALELSNAGED